MSISSLSGTTLRSGVGRLFKMRCRVKLTGLAWLVILGLLALLPALALTAITFSGEQLEKVGELKS